MKNIKPTDKLKVASVIADTLGADSSGASAEMMVNNALRHAKKNSLMTRGEPLKILKRMLDMATEVGISFDASIIKFPIEEENDIEFPDYDTLNDEPEPKEKDVNKMKFKEYVKSKEGHSLGASNDTHRKQLVKKLRDL